MTDEDEIKDPCGCCGESLALQASEGYQTVSVTDEESDIILLDTGTQICGFCYETEIRGRQDADPWDDEENDSDDWEERCWRMDHGCYD